MVSPASISSVLRAALLLADLLDQRGDLREADVVVRLVVELLVREVVPVEDVAVQIGRAHHGERVPLRAALAWPRASAAAGRRGAPASATPAPVTADCSRNFLRFSGMSVSSRNLRIGAQRA